MTMPTMPQPGYPGPDPDPRARAPFPPPQGPPPGYPAVPPPMPRPPGRQRPTVAPAVLAVVSIIAVAVGLSVKEDGRNAWDSVHAWGGLAVLGAVLTLAPALGRAFGLTERRAVEIAAFGAGALVLFWVLFTLPVVGSNTSLATTVGVAAGALAAWLAAGRHDRGTERPVSW